MVDMAMQYGHVVRLKAATRLSLGEDRRNWHFAAEFHIPATYVPGISSSIAVQVGRNTIDIRGVNEVLGDYWYDILWCLSSDIPLAAQSTATVVVLMGMRKLAEIIDIFSNNIVMRVTVAVMQSGSSRRKKVFTI